MRDFFAYPDVTDAATASLVLAMHLTGVDDSMRDAARQFCDAGFAVYVPDLYQGLDAPDPDTEHSIEAFMRFAKQPTTDSIDSDIQRATQHLRAAFPRTRIGIVGFCMGGRIAMVRAAGYSDILSAAAIWYGFADEIDPRTIDIPIIGSFGAEDRHIPPDKVASTFAALPVEHDLRIYEGAQHGFFHKESAFDPQAAADSFARSVAFLKRHLVP